jgi:mannose-1-phosphate guanylyltransferase
MKHCAVLLAGGSGRRLWPLSRQSCPKQLIALPAAQGTLLEATVRRFSCHLDWDIAVVTTAEYVASVTHIVQPYGAKVIIEPCARNTAPAIALACRELKKDYADDVVLVIVPTDHIIAHEPTYNKLIDIASRYVAYHDVLALLGVPQRMVSVQFGFIERGDELMLETALYSVRHFHEKPSLEIASVYKERSDIVWNVGVVIARSSVLWSMSPLLLNSSIHMMRSHQYHLIMQCSSDVAIKQLLFVVILVGQMWERSKHLFPHLKIL